LRHIDAVAAGPGWKNRLEVTLAALFHDSVYLPGRSDNEERSAELAAGVIPTLLPEADLARVRQLILLTARHGTLTRAELADDADAMHFLDADMAIIGASPAAFDAYDAAVAEEYSNVVPAMIFRFNRRRFLQRLLDLDRIFLSDFFHARLDAGARANLRRVLER
jgi:predicted metal-dependent HD superfamily phosphohydrolase